MKITVSNLEAMGIKSVKEGESMTVRLALSLDFGCWMLLTFSDCKTAKGVRFPEVERVATVA